MERETRCHLVASTVSSFLAAHPHIRIQAEWTAQLVAFLADQASPLTDDVIQRELYQQFLHADLRDVGEPAEMQPNSARGVAVAISGVLQVMDVLEIGESALSLLSIIQDLRKSSSDPNGVDLNAAVRFPRKMLRFVLTDGTTEIIAFEYRPIRQLDIYLPLGLKINVKAAPIARGVMFLDPQNIDILGGQIDGLNEDSLSLKTLRIEQRLRALLKMEVIAPDPAPLREIALNGNTRQEPASGLANGVSIAMNTHASTRGPGNSATAAFARAAEPRNRRAADEDEFDGFLDDIDDADLVAIDFEGLDAKPVNEDDPSRGDGVDDSFIFDSVDKPYPYEDMPMRRMNRTDEALSKDECGSSPILPTKRTSAQSKRLSAANNDDEAAAVVLKKPRVQKIAEVIDLCDDDDDNNDDNDAGLKVDEVPAAPTSTLSQILNKAAMSPTTTRGRVVEFQKLRMDSSRGFFLLMTITDEDVILNVQCSNEYLSRFFGMTAKDFARLLKASPEGLKKAEEKLRLLSTYLREFDGGFQVKSVPGTDPVEWRVMDMFPI